MGMAYQARIEEVQKLDDGRVRVRTTKDAPMQQQRRSLKSSKEMTAEEKQIMESMAGNDQLLHFSSGDIDLAWKHTKNVQRRRRSEEEVLVLLAEKGVEPGKFPCSYGHLIVCLFVWLLSLEYQFLVFATCTDMKFNSPNLIIYIY